MTPEELKSIMAEQVKELQNNLGSFAKTEDMQKEVASLKKQIEDQNIKGLETQMSELQKTAEDLGMSLKKLESGTPANVNELHKAFTAKADVIKNIRKGETIEVYKTVGDMTTSNGSNASVLSPLYGILNSDEINDIRLRTPFIEDFASVTSTNKGTFSYTDYKPKEGDVTVVGEGVKKTQLDLNWVTTPLTPVKAAGYEVVTDEMLTDVPQLEGVAKGLLAKKYLLRRQAQILTYVISKAKAFDSATWTGEKKALPNLYDAIVAATNQIQLAANYTDDIEFMPNVVYLNPSDYNALRIKTDEKIYIFPQLNHVAEGTLNGLRIIAKATIPAGKILIGDFSKLNIVNYVNYAVTMGWINEQFIYNQLTMVGEGRFYHYIRTLDELAFIYDDISDIITGITEAVN